MTKQLENQINWFDLLNIPPGSDPASLSTKTSRAHSQVQAATTSKRLSNKASGLSNRKLPICLCLKKDGPSMEWSTIPTESGALPGLSMMPNFSEFRSGDPGWLFCVTTGEYVPVKSSLSSILEENADPSLNLSEKACQGILNRAEKRGKELPEELRKALERQARGIGSTEYKLSEQRERTDQADHPMSSSASEEECPFVMN